MRSITTLVDGLSLLLRDNDDSHRSFQERVALWRDKSEEDLNREMNVLRHARALWLFISVVAWNAISLTSLGFIVNYLFRNDFHLTLGRLVAIVATWVTSLFVVWLVANVFDRYAGFERWFKAFALREKVGKESTDRLEKLLILAQHYPEVQEYKAHVLAHRPLRSEDLRLMEEMGRQRRNAELLSELEKV